MGHNKSKWGWAFYDWANSGFSTIILTFVYATFFTQSIVTDANQGASLWGYALSISGFLLAVLAPLLGGAADLMGRLKKFIFLGTFICCLATAGLWFGVPQASAQIVFIVLSFLLVANLGFEHSLIFYFSLLKENSNNNQIGKISGLGWAFGYAGGLVSLAAVLFIFVGLGDIKPLLPLPQEYSEHIRAVTLFTALWYGLCAVPFFLFAKDRADTGIKFIDALRLSCRNLKSDIIFFWQDKKWRNFFIGSALYRDGLNTLFALGGIYAASHYGMGMAEVLLFGIAINVSAGIGCAVMALLEDKIGSFKVIRNGLIFLSVGLALLLLQDDKHIFLLGAFILGLWIGPVQSAGRAALVKMADGVEVTKKFGFYALTGRAIAFLGPLLFAFTVSVTESQILGMATIIFFWLAGYYFIKDLHEHKI